MRYFEQFWNETIDTSLRNHIELLEQMRVWADLKLSVDISKMYYNLFDLMQALRKFDKLADTIPCNTPTDMCDCDSFYCSWLAALSKFVCLPCVDFLIHSRELTIQNPKRDYSMDDLCEIFSNRYQLSARVMISKYKEIANQSSEDVYRALTLPRMYSKEDLVTFNECANLRDFISKKWIEVQNDFEIFSTLLFGSFRLTRVM